MKIASSSAPFTALALGQTQGMAFQTYAEEDAGQNGDEKGAFGHFQFEAFDLI